MIRFHYSYEESYNYNHLFVAYDPELEVLRHLVHTDDMLEVLQWCRSEFGTRSDGCWTAEDTKIWIKQDAHAVAFRLRWC